MIIILKIKGSTLITALFSLSIYLSCIITFVTLYNTARKQIIRIDSNYKSYITELEKKETNLCLDNGLENLAQDLQ